MSQKNFQENYKTGVTDKSRGPFIDNTVEYKAFSDQPDINHPFGNVYARPGLDTKSREIAAIAVLTGFGSTTPVLKSHIRRALEAGCSFEEITEVIIQVSVYVGFPAALNAMLVAEEVMREFSKNQAG